MSEALTVHKKQIRHVAACGGWLDIKEADETMNDFNRRIVKAIKTEHGTAYLGNVNYQKSDKSDIEVVYEEYAGQTLYNFCAGFVVPCKDEVIEELVLDWRKNASTKALDRLFSHIEAIGGYNLIWS